MKKINALMAAFGCAVFVYTLTRLGWHNTFQQMAVIGWGLAAVVALRAFSQTIFTYAWHWTFPREQRKIRFRDLLRVRLAGEAINYLVPSGTFGGEPLKAQLLRPQIGLANSIASVTLAKYSFILAQLLMMLVGGAVVAATTPLPPAFKAGLLSALGVITLGLAVLYYGQRRGMFSWISRRLMAFRLGHSFLVPKLEKIAKLDQTIASFHEHQGRDFLFSVLLNVVGWSEGIVEVLILLAFLKLPASFSSAFLIESLSLVINAAFFFVPWQAGTQEAGKVLIFQMLGLPAPAGFALGLTRRLREMVWAGIGLLCFVTFKDKTESKKSGWTESALYDH